MSALPNQTIKHSRLCPGRNVVASRFTAGASRKSSRLATDVYSPDAESALA
jgi:hypothetical protein